MAAKKKPAKKKTTTRKSTKKTTKRKTTKRTTTKKKKSTRKKTGEVLLVGSKVKATLKSAGCNTAGDALAGLNEMIHWYVTQAAVRAKANGRKTVRAHDFMA